MLRGHDSDIRLTMPARAENVALVRHVTAALAEAVGLPEPLVDDIRLAVTEACTNVVRHAYAGEVGPLEVLITPEPQTLTVTVVDHGQGIGPSPNTDGAGLGLPLIAALATELEIAPAADCGSRLCMSFRSQGDTLQAA